MDISQAREKINTMNKYPNFFRSLCLTLFLLLNSNSWSFAQDKAIIELLNGFMKAIETRDSVKMYAFFADVPVTWVGVWRSATQEQRLKKDGSAPGYKVSDFKTWFRSIAANGFKQEKFQHPVIVSDESIAAVTFEYSFWANGRKGNWGKESWGLIKLNGQWKIASVLFSMDLESVKKEASERNTATEIKNDQIEQYMQSIIGDTHFQGTILLARGDSIIHHAAYGMFDIENEVPNRIDTRFLIGSLTKSFVAVAVMKLVEENKINLEESINSYLPGLKKELSKGLTIHHLLKQQSGLEASFDNLTNYEIMDITPGELLAIINQSKRSFEPGTKYQYTNINYTLLAMVIETVSGMSYQQYLQNIIFDKAGMFNTGMERLTNIPANRAIGYRKINGTIRRVHNVVAYAYGAGDIYATAFDLFKWRNAMIRQELVSGSSLAQMFQGAEKDWGYYGYGFRIQPYNRGGEALDPGKLIRHGGTMNGFISNFHEYRDDDLTVIVLSNYRDIPIRRITYQLKELALGFKPGKRKNQFEE